MRYLWSSAVLVASLLLVCYNQPVVPGSGAGSTAQATPLPGFPTALPTPAAQSSTTTSFSIGPGWADVIPHQLVRTADDRLYFFGIKGESSPVLVAHWTTNAGLPSSGSDFSGSTQVTYANNVISVSTVYDGGHIIHVLTNDQNGIIADTPFDTTTNQFKTKKTLDTAGGTVSGNYLGTGGIAGMIDQSMKLQIAYWSSNSHILYRSYSYNATQDSLTLLSGPTQVDASGNADHPALAISPVDGSVIVAWVSEASTPAQILVRVDQAGTWGSISRASSAPVWTSTSFGINIDQGPSLIVDSQGLIQLAYIEDYLTIGPNFDYGRIHYVTSSSTGWVDQYIGSYTHDPALAINSAGQVVILGHGYPLNSNCTSMLDLCLYSRNSNGTWATPQVFLAHQGSQSFDSSTSVKWSVIGYNRPDVIEFTFSEVGSGYDNPVLFYGRIGTGSQVTLTPSLYLPVARH